MSDLFRFMIMRPANVVPSEDVKVLSPSYAEQGELRSVAEDAARNFVAQNSILRSIDGLTFGSVAFAVASALGQGPIPAKDVGAIIDQMMGLTTKKISADPRFATEETLLANSLTAMKLLSSSFGGDAPGLARAAQGYDAIRLAASGRDPIPLRVLSIIDLTNDMKKDIPPVKLDVPKVNQLPPEMPDPPIMISKLDAAIATLRTLPAAGFQTVTPEMTGNSGPPVVRLDRLLMDQEQITPEQPAELARPTVSLPSVVRRPWMLSSEAVSLLPTDVRETISQVGLDLSTQPLPVALDALYTQKIEQLKYIERTAVPAEMILRNVGGFWREITKNDYVGSPTAALPDMMHGNIKPVGIGDLMLVKEHILRYEGGDLAHVENVLKSEHLSRDTRRLERTETTIFQETETTKEEQRDTQTTDRFSLKRETSDTIKTDASFKAGLSVDAKYGPFVEVQANADVATSTSVESSTKQSSEFSKDVVERSASKITERVLERRSVTTITEFEEKYSHGFDNTQGTAHISGFYQWIDKVSQAQVYNYGMRLLFDVILPEPATNYILALNNTPDRGLSLKEPPPFDLTADQINEGNYTLLAKMYDVTGLEPPPSLNIIVSKTFDIATSDSPYQSTKSEVLMIQDGYRAKYALIGESWYSDDSAPFWQMLIGNNWFDVIKGKGYLDMSGEVGSVPVAFVAHRTNLLAATLEIFCERTEDGFTAWQLKTHAAITQAYLAKMQVYEEALSQARAAAGTVIAGRNPAFNAQIVATELRKQFLTLLTGQQFDAFGALELSSEGYAQPNLSQTEAQMSYIRFFEHAFEWDHILYFFYPYFWGWKKAWNKRMLLDDTDPAFADFLRAGAVRVVVPVRIPFMEAIMNYTESGKLWDGGAAPNIGGSLYVPIVKEIQDATGAPGTEKPVGDPWLVTLPTTLVQLRPNDDRPTWQKVGEDWQPTN